MKNKQNKLSAFAKMLSFVVVSIGLHSNAQAAISTDTGVSYGHFWGNGTFTASLSEQSLIMNPEPSYLTVLNASGDFQNDFDVETLGVGPFDPRPIAALQSIISFGDSATNSNSPSPLIDMGYVNFATGTFTDIDDGKNGFYMDSAHFSLQKENPNDGIAIIINAFGEIDVDGERARGHTILTLQTTDWKDKTLAEAYQALENGETLSDLTISGSSSVMSFGLSSSPTPVPEPSTYALFGIAFTGLGIIGYRKRRIS